MSPNRRDNIIKNPSWWKRRSSMERHLIMLLTIALLITIILFIILITSYLAKEKSTVCMTPDCVASSYNLIQSMDTTIKPCDNFYKFACGKFIRNTYIPEDKSGITQFSILDDLLLEQMRPLIEAPIEPDEPIPFRLMKNYYKACMNVDVIEKTGLTRIKEIMHESGGWPALEEDWNDEDFHWMKTVLKLRKFGYNANLFIDFSISVDLKHSNNRIIDLDEITVGLPREYIIKGRNDSVVKSYYDTMVSLAEIFGVDRKTAIEQYDEVIEFQMKFANITLPSEKRRNISELYNVMKISEVQSKFPSIHWLKYINDMMYPAQNVTEDEVISLTVPGFLSKLEKLLAETPKRTQANYIMWRIVEGSISYLHDEIRQKELDFSKVLTGKSSRDPRWKECTNMVTVTMGIASSVLYIKNYFDEDAKNNALEMVNYIQQEFVDSLKVVDWMDEETKKRALEKAEAIRNNIGYPDELLNMTKITEYYDGLQLDGSDYLISVLNTTLYENRFEYKLLRNPVNETAWADHGKIVAANAYYFDSYHSIDFPAGILQGVFFNKNRPKYLNYAAIGFVIGHEITHGFDDKGRQKDKSGNLADWWAPDTKKAFIEKAQCFIDQYGNFTVEDIGININGVLTQGENIADNGGVKTAYSAYTKWVEKNNPEPKLPGLDFTPNQLFWLSCANMWCEKYRPESYRDLVLTDAHAPAIYRILGTFGNMEQFSKDFNCEPGTPMNPVHKCSIW